MKLAIIGSRTFSDYALLQATMQQWFKWAPEGKQLGPYDVTEVVSGGAKGADSAGARWATKCGLKLTVFKPDWERFGKRAGFLRNEDIIAAADMVLAFWGVDPEGKELSRGTAHSLSIAKRLKKPTIIIYI